MFRSYLLSLFTACRSCHQLCTGEVAQQMETFISIKQACSHCGHVWMWNSQPFIKNIPTGNILLSAAILFSGSTPTKVLHFLNCLRVACITDRTFYLHQRQYLEPSVQSVWNHKQQQLLSACELKRLIYLQKRLKTDAVPTVFAKSTNHVDASSSSYTPCSRPLSERREQRSVSVYRVHVI